MHAHDRGLAFDLRTSSRRRAPALVGGGALAVLVGCSDERSGPAASSGSTTASTAATGASASATCETIPEETAGPYPADGSNGPNVLSEDGIVRRDIRSSFGWSSTVAEGVPLTIEIELVDSTACSPLAGAAVYLWRCDREGRYSLYSSGVEGARLRDDYGTITSPATAVLRSVPDTAPPGRAFIGADRVRWWS